MGQRDHIMSYDMLYDMTLAWKILAIRWLVSTVCSSINQWIKYHEMLFEKKKNDPDPRRCDSWSRGCDPWSRPITYLWSLIPYIYVICWLGGPYWEKLCQRSWVRPEAAGRGPYSRPRAQFFPIRTDLGRQITCLLLSSVEYFVSSFCVEFSLQPFSNLRIIKFIFAMIAVVIWIHNCLFLRTLFTF